MPGVTISASYGAGGSIIAPRVAERLGLQFLDRAISSAVAKRLQVSLPEAEGGAVSRSRADRFLGLLAPLAGGALGAGTDAAPPNAVPPPDDASLFREQAEAIMREAMANGAVILGRGGAAALRARGDVLRVRLFGSPDACVAQAARIEDIDLNTARRRQREVDAARAKYVRRLYSVDIDDPAPFIVQLDSTALSPDASVDVIVTAYERFSQP
jgi:cytidylate kinase